MNIIGVAVVYAGTVKPVNVGELWGALIVVSKGSFKSLVFALYIIEKKYKEIYY